MREPRDSGIKKKVLLTPFDVTKFGGPEDPCFGRELDLNADECQICGDVEICQIAMMQGAHAVRLQLEKENTYKDQEEVEMVELEEARQFVNEKVLAGWGNTRIKVVLQKKFKTLTKQQIKTLLT